MPTKKQAHQLKHMIIFITTLSLSIFILTALTITIYGLHDNVHKSDVGIILGSKINPNGTLSPRLVARVDKGIALYQAGMIKNIIVSGGTGTEKIDEAQAMKKYLLQHNIPEEQIITDSQGYNTAATAKNSAIIMRDHEFQTAVIISQFFHIARANLALKKSGISSIYHAHANFYELRDIYSLGREVVGFYDYLFFRLKR